MSDITVQRVIEKLPSRFVAENAEELTVVFQFFIEDDQDFYISVANKACDVQTGEHDDPNLSLFMDAETVVDVVNGEVDGMGAFLSGRLRAEGNLLVATHLSKLFSKDKPDA